MALTFAERYNAIRNEELTVAEIYLPEELPKPVTYDYYAMYSAWIYNAWYHAFFIGLWHHRRSTATLPKAGAVTHMAKSVLSLAVLTAKLHVAEERGYLTLFNAVSAEIPSVHVQIYEKCRAQFAGAISGICKSSRVLDYERMAALPASVAVTVYGNFKESTWCEKELRPVRQRLWAELDRVEAYLKDHPPEPSGNGKPKALTNTKGYRNEARDKQFAEWSAKGKANKQIAKDWQCKTGEFLSENAITKAIGRYRKRVTDSDMSQ